MKRRKCREVKLRQTVIGGSAPISVQTMSTVNPADYVKGSADCEGLSRAHCSGYTF